MEIIKKNFINTTTLYTVDSNSITAENLINTDKAFQYVSDGFDNDLTTTSIVTTFDSTTAVSRLSLLDINLKEFNLFYDGVTANTFSFINSSTNTSQFISNSETSLYFQSDTIQCSSITLDMKSTQVADSEKAIGQLILSEEYLDFPLIASAKNYKPLISVKDIVHKMADGGIRINILEEKQSASVKFTNISESFRNNLRTIFDIQDSFIFVPFGTAASWDRFIFETPWIGGFDFYKHSDNAVNAGYSGTIKMSEV